MLYCVHPYHPGEFYTVAPIVNFVPQKPYIKVTPNEIHPDSAKSRNRDDPTQAGPRHVYSSWTMYADMEGVDWVS